MNLNNLLLVHSVLKYEQIPHSISQLYQIMSKKQVLPDFLLIPYLVYESNIEIDTYESFVTYIHTISDWFCDEKQYNSSETAWYQFYIIIRAYKNCGKDMEKIYNAYLNLPQLQTNSELLQWIGLEVKREMLFYYVSLDINPLPVIEDINSYPDRLLRMDY